jgi:hypothetical protein
MIALHQNHGQLKGPGLVSTDYLVIEHSAAGSSEPESESSLRSETAADVNRIRLVIWGFVFFNFAAFFFCGWLLWTKCHGH